MKEQAAKTIYTANDLMSMGFSKAMAYQLMNRADMPIIRIGSRKFMHKQKFDQWLEQQADTKDVVH